MSDFIEIIWWALLVCILLDEIQACTFGGRTMIVEIFSNIQITKTQVFFGVCVGFFLPMVFLAAAYVAPPEAKPLVLAALACVIPSIILYGGKLANLLHGLCRNEMSPSSSLIFRTPKEVPLAQPIEAFSSFTHRPATPPPRLAIA